MNQIGILGGGQLALMLAEAAQDWGAVPHIFAASKDDPAYRYTERGVVSQLNNEKNLAEFFSKVGVIIFESDFLPFEVLEKFKDLKFIPSLDALRLLSDKGEQRKICQELGLPIPKFAILDAKRPAKEVLEPALATFGGRSVLKWTRGGYDGKGVLINPADIQAAAQFVEAARQKGSGVLIEDFVEFEQEAAQLAVYSTKGDWKFYPLVLTEQRGGICHEAWGPATAFGISESLQQQIQGDVKKLGERLKIFGTFAVEVFLLSGGRYLINEIAPRVHNSGHFSINAALTSQFENHIRAILGMSLGDTRVDECFLMLNLLGDRKQFVRQLPAFPERQGLKLKWYNKTELRPGRKMGHINRWGFDPADLENVRAKEQQLKDEWLKGVV